VQLLSTAVMGSLVATDDRADCLVLLRHRRRRYSTESGVQVNMQSPAARVQ